MTDRRDRTLHWVLLLAAAAVLVWSGVRPVHRTVWALEVAPAVVAGAILLATYRRFRLTNLAYVLIWVHAIILMVGGRWTYEQNPLFEWLREALDLQRNHYDRLGHVAQGFVPAIVVRELLLRTSPLRAGKWLFALVLGTCLGVSALYELVEWWVALIGGGAGVQFLAAQGDPWDTQWDMFLCLCGAIVSLVALRRVHDAQLRRLAAARPAGRRAAGGD